MNQEMLDLMVATAQHEVRKCGAQIDRYGEALMRQALIEGHCIQITIPTHPGQTVCPMAVTGNEDDSRVWFVRNGKEDFEMRERFEPPIRQWVSNHRGR